MRWLRQTRDMKGLTAMPTTIALYYLSLIAISFLQDDTSSDFSDLGKKLLGGFASARQEATCGIYFHPRSWRKRRAIAAN